MTSFQVTITNTRETFSCRDDTDVLRAMEQLQRKGIPVGCRNGGCGVCKVAITAGSYTQQVMSREHVSEADEREGRVLACRVKPASDIRLKVLGRMRQAVCRSCAEPGLTVRAD